MGYLLEVPFDFVKDQPSQKLHIPEQKMTMQFSLSFVFFYFAAVPMSSRWGNRETFYPIEIAEYGLSEFTKHLHSDPPERMIYENGEDEKSLVSQLTLIIYCE